MTPKACVPPKVYDSAPPEEQAASAAAAAALRLQVSGSAACPVPLMNKWEAARAPLPAARARRRNTHLRHHSG